MAGLFAVLKSLRTASKRDRQSLWSFSTNNLFLTALLLGIGGAFFLCVMAAVLILPLSGDPLRMLPPDRLRLWPLTQSEGIRLRLVSPWLNPITWAFATIAVVAAFHGRPVFVTAVLLIPTVGLTMSWARPRGDYGIWRAVPRFPGMLGQLIRKDLRELLSTLDFWTALALSASCSLFRVLVHELPGDALLVFSLLVVIALSTWAQSCFGLDRPEGLIRYRLMPLRGWQIFAVKATAFLVVVTILALPLSLPAAWASASMALAVGNAGSISVKSQRRWRFSSGVNIWLSVVQIVLLVATGTASVRISHVVLIYCFLLLAASCFWFGRRLFD